MQLRNNQSDDAVLKEIGARVTRARLDRNRTQAQLCEDAGIGRNTLQRLEAGDGVGLTAFIRVLRALGLLEGLEATIPSPVPSPIEQLDSGGRQRRRASGRRDNDDWRWGTP
jgi:putative transcriptional regulator